MFGISGEHLLVLLVILLIFGPRRLPDLGNSLGRAMKGFKDAMNGNVQDSTETKTEAPKQIQETAETAMPPKSEPVNEQQETRV